MTDVKYKPIDSTNMRPIGINQVGFNIRAKTTASTIKYKK